MPSPEEVERHHDREPDAEDHPGDRRQAGEHVDAGGDGEHRRDGVAGHLERTLEVGLGASQHEHPDRDRGERHQRADGHGVPQVVGRDEPGDDRDHDTDDDRVEDRGQGARVHLGELVGQHPVAAHGEQDAGLAVERDQGDREDRDHGPGGQDRARDGVAGDVLEDDREAGALLVRAGELLERLRADTGDGHEHIDRDHDDQRADDRPRQRALRVADLLTRGGDRVEADEGEEDRAGRGADARRAGRKKLSKRSASNAVSPMMMNITRTLSLMSTMIVLTLADSLAPRISSSVHRPTSTIAGRLTRPFVPSYGMGE